MIFVTGSNDWTNVELIRAVLSGLPKRTTILHGGDRWCDAHVDAIAVELGFDVKVYPADWHAHGTFAPLIRSQEMAKDCLSAFAFWNGQRNSPDTVEAIGLVLHEGKHIDVYLPSGRAIDPHKVVHVRREAD